MPRYITQGTCASSIEFEIEEGILRRVRFLDGCDGNLEGISRLVEGMPIEEVIRRLKGIRCQGETSCPDQLAKALEEYLPAQDHEAPPVQHVI